MIDELDDMPSAEEHKSTGNTHFKAGKLDEAIAAYKQAVRIQPDFKEAWCNLGQCYYRQSKFDEALEAFSQAITADPHYAKPLFRRAETLMQLERYKEAAPAICQAELSVTTDAQKVQLRKYLQVCQAKIGAQIHFGSMDLKLTPDGNVKILEFGPGLASSFDGFNAITDGPKMSELLSAALKKTGLPFS